MNIYVHIYEDRHHLMMDQLLSLSVHPEMLLSVMTS